MIKFELRRNLIYPLQYLIWTLARDFLTMFIKFLFTFTDSYAYIPFMFLGEIFLGGLFHLYLKKIMPKKSDNKEQYFMAIKLIKNEEDDNDYFAPLDSKVKIIILIFFASVFDAISFLLDAVITPKFKSLSASLSMRLYGFATISASFTYVYALKLPLFRHHKFSLSVIGFCLIVVIISEYFFQTMDLTMNYLKLTMAIVSIIISQILISCQDSIEKYLFEYNYMNPFVVLMYEGLFGFFISFLNLIDENYFHDFVDIYKDKNSKEFALFIFLLIVFIILSGGKNLFRIVTTKIYSPMVTTLLDYVLNPIYLIYYYGAQGDFKKEDGKLDVAYFTINIIISLIISFFGCVYNEFIILFFCGLERNTHDQVSKRASSKIDENLTELMKFDESTEMSMNDETNSVIK